MYKFIYILICTEMVIICRHSHGDFFQTALGFWSAVRSEAEVLQTAF